ncbi:neuropeptide FF receptor 1 isoform X2 [Camelus ferus]|uniref:Neuropeptide FF receptor 1 n=2 Tax=Camelus TaxID=9836 RepID=A0A8B8U023_CAMFR|nr:neuropeptide FF receptor 1 isoform X2 [Camelus ferus]
MPGAMATAPREPPSSGLGGRAARSRRQSPEWSSAAPEPSAPAAARPPPGGEGSETPGRAGAWERTPHCPLPPGPGLEPRAEAGARASNPAPETPCPLPAESGRLPPSVETVPEQAGVGSMEGWPFDNATCKMSGLVQGMSVSASVFTLVAIAVERFRCIVHPFREKLTLRKALLTIAVIWALALLIMCPSAVTLTVTREEHHFMVDTRNRSYPLYSCWEAWPEKGMRKVYTAVLFSHIYLAPLALIVVMYARIARKLCKAPGPARAGEETAGEAGRGARRRARVVHMLVIVALFFTLSWLPLWALLLLIDYGQLSEPQLHLVTVYAFPFAHWLAFFNSSANPIIYGYFNENFRRGFQAAFRGQLCRPPWGGHREAYSERPGGLLRTRVFVEVQPSDSGLPFESGPSSGAPRPGRLPLRNGRVAHHGLAAEGPGCAHLPLTTPAWDI